MGGSPERAKEMARIRAIERDWLVLHYGPLGPGEDPFKALQQDVCVHVNDILGAGHPGLQTQLATAAALLAARR